MIDTFGVKTPFEDNRIIRVYLPKNYEDSMKRYPVLYMNDGQNVFHDEEAVGGVSLDLKRYLDDNEINYIVVGIDSNPVFEERVNELCPWVNGEYSRKHFGDERSIGGKGDTYLEFIVKELKPLLDARYRTLKGKTTMAGISLGGLMSVYAACRYPEIFTRVAGVSSAFFRNQEEISELIQRSDLSTIDRVYLDCGNTETSDEKISEAFLNSNKEIVELVELKVKNTRFVVSEGAKHSYTFFRKRFSKALHYLIEEW